MKNRFWLENSKLLIQPLVMLKIRLLIDIFYMINVVTVNKNNHKKSMNKNIT